MHSPAPDERSKLEKFIDEIVYVFKRWRHILKSPLRVLVLLLIVLGGSAYLVYAGFMSSLGQPAGVAAAPGTTPAQTPDPAQQPVSAPPATIPTGVAPTQDAPAPPRDREVVTAPAPDTAIELPRDIPPAVVRPEPAVPEQPAPTSAFLCNMTSGELDSVKVEVVADARSAIAQRNIVIKIAGRIEDERGEGSGATVLAAGHFVLCAAGATNCPQPPADCSRTCSFSRGSTHGRNRQWARAAFVKSIESGIGYLSSSNDTVVTGSLCAP